MRNIVSNPKDLLIITEDGYDPTGFFQDYIKIEDESSFYSQFFPPVINSDTHISSDYFSINNSHVADYATRVLSIWFNKFKFNKI